MESNLRKERTEQSESPSQRRHPRRLQGPSKCSATCLLAPPRPVSLHPIESYAPCRHLPPKINSGQYIGTPKTCQREFPQSSTAPSLSLNVIYLPCSVGRFTATPTRRIPREPSTRSRKRAACARRRSRHRAPQTHRQSQGQQRIAHFAQNAIWTRRKTAPNLTPGLEAVKRKSCSDFLRDLSTRSPSKSACFERARAAQMAARFAWKPLSSGGIRLSIGRAGYELE